MNVRVDLNTPITDGTEVVFRSPVDCSQVTGLIVYYDGGTASKEFAFADAHGNNVGDIDHLFAENVVVKVILDTVHSMAFVQNADTNAYLEGRFQSMAADVAAVGDQLANFADILLQVENPCVLTHDSEFFIGWLNPFTGEFGEEDSTSKHRASDFVELKPGVVYQCDCFGYGHDIFSEPLYRPDSILIYNADKTFSRQVADETNISLEGNEKYLRIGHSFREDYNLYVYEKGRDPEDIKITLNPDLEIPQLEDLEQGGGYTPVKGVDYWTEEDIAEIKSYVDDAILGGEW